MTSTKKGQVAALGQKCTPQRLAPPLYPCRGDNNHSTKNIWNKELFLLTTKAENTAHTRARCPRQSVTTRGLSKQNSRVKCSNSHKEAQAPASWPRAKKKVLELKRHSNRTAFPACIDIWWPVCEASKALRGSTLTEHMNTVLHGNCVGRSGSTPKPTGVPLFVWFLPRVCFLSNYLTEIWLRSGTCVQVSACLLI